MSDEKKAVVFGDLDPFSMYSQWQDTTDVRTLPVEGWPVFLYLPETGNDDDGWGYVEVGQLSDRERLEWKDFAGFTTQPTLWAYVRIPEPAVVYDKPHSEGGKPVVRVG